MQTRLSAIKETTTGLLNKNEVSDESQNHYAEWEKHGRKEYTLYDSIYVKF